MFFKIKTFIAFVFCLWNFIVFAQYEYPMYLFHLPIDSEYKISSNFGEIRPAHFHTGLDYGTKKKLGVNIYAIYDGYVSRVKVSGKGYGNAIYITHPNGFVSVYAHLGKFGNKVSEYVRKVQHERQQFEIDDYLYPGEFKVKKGQVIGKSGNTGRSYGPHLHFEIRDQITEEPINPLFFGFDLEDTEPPRIEGLYMYQFIRGMEQHKYYFRQEIKNPVIDTMRAFGTLGFGAEIHDYMLKKSKDRFGVYQIEMFIDDSLLYKYQMNRMSFDESKYLNSFIDYDLYRADGLKISKCFVEPNNKLGIYQSSGNGLFEFTDGKLHKIRISANDINNNAVDLTFFVQSDSALKVNPPLLPSNVVLKLDYRKKAEFKRDSFKISFPENSFYYNINFRYSKTNIGKTYYSDYHHVHNQYIPLSNQPVISIKPYPVPLHLKEKLIIVGIGSNNRPFSAGGKWNEDFLETAINSFGTYYVAVDTIAPKIYPISLKKSIELKSDILSFEITDNLSGIKDYTAFIDDSWVLFEYDEKNNLITCDLSSEMIEPGKHFLVLWVRDKSGNIGSFESNFIY